MKRLVLFTLVALVALSSLVGSAREIDTEDGKDYGHAMSVVTNIVGGTLNWTNSLQKPSCLRSISWLLPASTTSTVTVSHVERSVTKTKTATIVTNSFFTPAVYETNYQPSSVVAYYTNTLYSGSTTNAQTVILDAGVSGDLPEYYRVFGGDVLQFSFSTTNDIPLKWSMEL